MNKIEVISNNIIGEYFAPPSKSHMFRALNLALYSKNAIIENPLYSDDVLNLLDIFENIGVKIIKNIDKLEIFPENISFIDHYDFKNSGTALRFITAFLAVKGISNTTITGDEQLKTRKIIELLKPLSQVGLKYDFINKDREIPFKISGKISSGLCSVNAEDSQYLSALLLNLPFLKNPSEIVVTHLNEKPYIDITLYWLNRLGIKYSVDQSFYSDSNIYPFKFFLNGGENILDFQFSIPADYSSASFFILGSILSGVSFPIKNLDKNDPQGDKFILQFLSEIGCEFYWKGNILYVKGSPKNGAVFDLNNTPDLLPPLVIFSAHYPFSFSFKNCYSARFKECDRIKASIEWLKQVGIDAEESIDGLSFIGGIRKTPIEVSGFNDHRFIMGSSLLTFKNQKNIVIKDISNLASSYPKFFNDLKNLGFIVNNL